MTECGKVINGVFTPCECGIINGVPTPCTRPNECCSNSFFYNNTCGLDYNFCSNFTQENLCGPCTTQYCFNYYQNALPNNNGSIHCPKQVSEFKDCKFTRGECIDGKSKITITKQANGGVACPTNQYETCDNCIISDWTACTNNTRTRRRTQAINGGIACTQYENALPLTQTCNNCIISDWTACTNNTRTRIRTQAINGGIACTQYENELPLTQTCANCEFTEWTNCLDNIRTRRIITFPINTVCPSTSSLIQIQECYDCVVSND